MPPQGIVGLGTTTFISQAVFPALAGHGLSGLHVEVCDDAQRIPHWHDCNEIGYMVSGTLQLLLWRSPTEADVLLVPPGWLYYVPQGTLHSGNTVSDGEPCVIAIGFDKSDASTADLPVAFGGLPAPVRDAYTSPHAQLRAYVGPTSNPLFTRDPLHGHVLARAKQRHSHRRADDDNPGHNSKYRFDVNAARPLFRHRALGSVVWAVSSNWHVLSETRAALSFIRVVLRPGTVRDAIWWPDASVLYAVTRGRASITLVLPGAQSMALDVDVTDRVLVPRGVLHTIAHASTGGDQDLEVVGFFNTANPLPEVSLLAATNFFPKRIANASLAAGTECKPRPLVEALKPATTSPYILAVNPAYR